ncbi:hypothetical protein PIN31009_00403 [Pandoraea iniqua]|nr:hypothetical protein PIN31009_00403 [Pandoraea iniqua]
MQGKLLVSSFLPRIFRHGALALSCLWPFAHDANAGTCSAPWPNVKPMLESAIRYSDDVKKSDPYITLTTRGQPVKMLLDTGSNVHVIWDKRLLGGDRGVTADESPAADATSGEVEEDETLHAIASSTLAQRTVLDLVDAQGRRVTQSFYVIDETPLMVDGFSGIISPQYLAQEKVSVIDFKHDCFFVSERFDPVAGGKFVMSAGRSLPNPHRVMAIPLGVLGARVPVVVDSGASGTTLLGRVIEHSPAGLRLPMSIDLLGNAIASDERARLVDLTINGETVMRHPVTPALALRDKGIVSLGSIGMDILKDRILFHDDDRHRFVFLEGVPARGVTG